MNTFLIYVFCTFDAIHFLSVCGMIVNFLFTFIFIPGFLFDLELKETEVTTFNVTKVFKYSLIGFVICSSIFVLIPSSAKANELYYLQKSNNINLSKEINIEWKSTNDKKTDELEGQRFAQKDVF